MKKILLLTVNVLTYFFAFGQTIVGTTQENKNVVLEEFTGIHCVYCPDGHAKAKAIQDANPQDVVLINIHTGSFATPNSGEPDFKTDFGADIAAQTGLTGYPSGTVNRHVFSGSNTILDRGSWAGAASTILGESAYVNIGIEAEIDVQTRVITIHVEAYYTGNSPQSTNKLNVVLMQNNTLGPQTGGGMGDQYVHMHRLVHMITGQWGEEITTTTTGSFIDKTYTYTIPADYKGVIADLGDMEVAVFMAESNQEINNGNRAYPTLTNFLTSNNAAIENITVPEKICENSVTPKVKIRNLGGSNLTSAEITYSVNGGTSAIYNWTGNLSPYERAEFDLNSYDYTQTQTNNYNVEISSVNAGVDEDLTDNSLSSSFEKSVETNNLVTLTLTTDSYASEISWKLFNSIGTEIKSGSGYGNNKTITETFFLPLDCYMFEIYDEYGDGGATYSLKDSDDITIHSSTGNYGAGEDTPFKTITEIQTYNVTFTVSDGNNPIENVEVDFSDFGKQTTNNLGVTVFTEVYPKNDIEYILSLNGFDTYTNSVSVIDGDVNINPIIIHTSLEKLNSDKLNIYPNPTNGILYIKSDEILKNAVLKVVTLKGDEIYSKNVEKDVNYIDISNHPKGIYIIKLVSSDFEKISKFILE